jgi:hypothetical protein
MNTSCHPWGVFCHNINELLPGKKAHRYVSYL